MARVLVVDDEPGVTRFVRRALENAGHEVDVASDGTEALAAALRARPDLVLLDLRLPTLQGEAVLAALLAQRPDQKVIVLSATDDVESKVHALEAGAVDYVAKPFALPELLARINARLREHPHDAGEASRQGVLRAGGLTLDLRTHTATRGGRVAHLSDREFLILAHLVRNAGRVCSREELLSAVWGYSFDPGSNVVDVSVSRLRAKLKDRSIETVRHVGYRLIVT
jgi:DNA-binding response OmpR family regulator